MTASGDFLRVDPGDKFKAVGLKAGLVEDLLFTTTKALPGETAEIELAEDSDVFFEDYTHFAVEVGGVKTSLTSTIPSVRALTRAFSLSWYQQSGSEQAGYAMPIQGLTGTGFINPIIAYKTALVAAFSYDVDERNMGIMRLWGLRPGLIAGESGTTASTVSTTARFATNGILGIGADGTFTARRLAIRPKHERLYNSADDLSQSNNPAQRSRGAQSTFTLPATTHLEDYHNIYFTINDYAAAGTPSNVRSSTEMTYGRQIRRAGEWNTITDQAGARKPTNRSGGAIHPLMAASNGGYAYMFLRSNRSVGDAAGGDQIFFDFAGGFRSSFTYPFGRDLRVQQMWGIRYELVDLDG